MVWRCRSILKYGILILLVALLVLVFCVFHLHTFPSRTGTSVHHMNATMGFRGQMTSVEEKSSHCVSTCKTIPILRKSTMPNVVVFGASSFIGSSLSLYLHKQMYNVIPMETGDEYTLNSLQYYRWNQLSLQELNPTFLQPNDVDSLFRKIGGIDEIIYIPHKIYDGVIEHEILTKDALICLELLVQLLEIFKDQSDTRVTLITKPEQRESSIQSSWLRTLENSMATYHNLHQVNITYIRLDGFHSPMRETEELNVEQRIQLSDMLEKIHCVVHHDTYGCLDLHVSGNSDTDKPLVVEAHEHLKQKNVVMSTYFTSIQNPQYAITIAKNTFRFMQEWLESAEKWGIETVVFHDSFSDSFMRRISENFKGISFEKVTSFKGRTPNDYRFYLQYKYLQDHPEISNIILSDIRDITFLNDPFKVMEIIGNYVFVGVDVSYYTDSWSHSYPKGLINACYRHEANQPSVTLHPFYNAGVIGGTRHLILKYLNYFTDSLDTTPRGRNCNMATVTIVTHKYFNDQSFSGYPFQSAFKMNIPGPQGLAIKHKMEKKNL